MHKRGLHEDEDAVDGLLTSTAKRSGWALCVGAGISLPAFPDWNQLVRRLFERIAPGQAPRLTASLGAIFSPDALIQAASVRADTSDEGFATIITHELYRDFLDSFSEEERRVVISALAAERPSAMSRANWARFLQLLADRWPSMSSRAIGPVVSEVLGTDRSPAAILSFNAEPLLLAVLHAHQSCNHHGEAGEGPPQRIDRVVRGISNRSVDRIPYLFCHGLLPVNDSTPADNLVFSESSYLQLAARVYSWQATSFLEACVARRVVFIGLSLTDANMRRWLSWVHDNRVEELEEIGRKNPISTQHYWLNLDPGDDEERAWIEASVAHLGVRLVWMKAWSSIGPVLARMLELRGRAE